MTFPDNHSFAFSQDQGAGSPQGTGDLFRRMLERMVQAAIGQQFGRHMGAGPWQRSAERRGWRNGSKPRRLKTRVGTIELRIPTDRGGQFQPSLFERYQRSEKALMVALVTMYIQGVDAAGQEDRRPAVRIIGLGFPGESVGQDAGRGAGGVAQTQPGRNMLPLPGGGRPL